MPISTPLVALEKVVAGVIQGVLAALLVLPVAPIRTGPIDSLKMENLLELIEEKFHSAGAFSALGLWMGTAIQPQQVSLMFSVIVAPMIMFGCAYYPWRGLDHVPVMKYAVLVNPLVYVAEGMRGALTPGMPHMPQSIVAAALALLTALFWIVGLKSFERRAVG